MTNCHQDRRGRSAFTLIELLVACAMAMVVLGALATLAVWNFRERTNLHAHQLALEAANNALEEARSRSPHELTPEWAASMTLREDPWLPEGKLTVLVAPEANEPGMVRVTAKVSWAIAAGRPRLDVELIGFFAANPSDSKKGDVK